VGEVFVMEGVPREKVLAVLAGLETGC
jgi:hypothetical protein